MAESAARLRRLLADELGDCCDADVERRLDELGSLADAAFGDDGARPAFAVLGDETRYRLARALAASDDERCVCELEPLVDVSESAVSHALSDLVEAGLADRRKERNWRYYAATPLADDLFAAADREAGGVSYSDRTERRTTESTNRMTESHADTETDPETTTENRPDPVRVAFVCVQNAGRSQMSLAFAEREVERRGLEDRVELLSGGTDPADHVHDEVAAVMSEAGFDVADRTPREVTPDELREADLVITMGCSAADVCPAGWGGESRDWGLDDPHGQDPERVREIRDEVERRVGALFDEIATDRVDEP